jgi:hypothetical protein
MGDLSLTRVPRSWVPGAERLFDFPEFAYT